MGGASIIRQAVDAGLVDWLCLNLARSYSARVPGSSTTGRAGTAATHRPSGHTTRHHLTYQVVR
jgi:hypothetical protein